MNAKTHNGSPAKPCVRHKSIVPYLHLIVFNKTTYTNIIYDWRFSVFLFYTLGNSRFLRNFANYKTAINTLSRMDMDFVITWVDMNDPKWQKDFTCYNG
ncbi:MAG: Stealth CR1 domain-containing protein, partial [Dysgonamonadaceae bacterium]|nr:Stealth CR1 domain-containing protein [Dysgonamonadaceae bacterium]